MYLQIQLFIFSHVWLYKMDKWLKKYQVNKWQIENITTDANTSKLHKEGQSWHFHSWNKLFIIYNMCKIKDKDTLIQWQEVGLRNSYDQEDYLNNGLISTVVKEETFFTCISCFRKLSNDNIKPSLLIIHFKMWFTLYFNFLKYLYFMSFW